MPTDKTKMVEDAYATFRRGDIDGFVANFGDDGLLIEAASLSYGGEHRGAAAAKAALIQIGGAWTDIGYDIHEILSGDRFVIAYGTFVATGRKTGKRIEMPLAEVWEFDGDRVKSVTPLYFDTAAAIAALA